MASRDKLGLRAQQHEGPAELEGLLAQIESETIPERLLILAQELQHALNERKRQLSLNGK
jgi:hypothetical protein